MRKTASIIMLMLIVFNTIGYKLYFIIALQKADNSLEASLNKNNYNPQDLITLKIPLNLPYQNIASSFERIDGEITVNGESYKYVQRKIQDDTLYLQCIPHTEKNTLEKKSYTYFGTVNGVTGIGDSKSMPCKNSNYSKFSFADFITNSVSPSNHLKYFTIGELQGLENFTFRSSTHLQKLIKPPQSV